MRHSVVFDLQKVESGVWSAFVSKKRDQRKWKKEQKAEPATCMHLFPEELFIFVSP